MGEPLDTCDCGAELGSTHDCPVLPRMDTLDMHPTEEADDGGRQVDDTDASDR